MSGIVGPHLRSDERAFGLAFARAWRREFLASRLGRLWYGPPAPQGGAAAGQRELALLALRDCGVIRAPALDEAYLALARAGLARWSPVTGHPAIRDYRLTDRGRRAALHEFGE